METYRKTQKKCNANTNWTTRSLKELANFSSGKPNEKYVVPNGEFSLITIDSIGIDGRLKKEHKSINQFDGSLKRNDIVSVMDDLAHGNLLGLCDVIPEDNSYVLNQRMGRLRLITEVDPFYLRYQINAHQKFFKERGQGMAQKHIYKRDFDSLEIPLPPLPEQHAIAEALGDADALIESLELLIAKKRAIRQATMQQLLTGQHRLPGFSGEWEVKKLGEIACIQRGASPRPIDDPKWFDIKSSVGWVRISDVTQSGKYLFNTTQKLSQQGIDKSRPVRKGNLIMSICATVGRPIITKLDTCIHDGFVIFDDLKLDIDFGYYVLLNIENDWSKHGQTGSQMNLNTDLINRTIFITPKEVNEQTAIAEVLSDMDAEIDALETKLAKTRQLKQGMMQQLLTGRIRLI